MTKYDDQLIGDYYKLMPSKYGYLESLSINRKIGKEGCFDYNIELVMRSLEDDKLHKKLRLFFWGAKKIRIGDIEGLLSLFIEIESIKHHQIEDINYKVAENEYQAFSFTCKAFKAIIQIM